MRYEVFLAIRNLRSRRRRRLTRVTAFVAVVGIAIGVAALIVALALANGFRDEMRQKILQGTAHLNVMRADGQPLTDYRRVAERIREIEQVVGASGTTYDGAVLIGPKGTSYAVLRGLEPDSQAARAELNRLMSEGSAAPLFEPKEGDLREIVLGAELATRTGLSVGDVAEIVSANTNANSAEPVRRLARVAGTFRTGLFEYDSTWIYLSLDLATVLTGVRDRVSVVSVQVKDIYDVKGVATKVRAALGEAYTTVDWQDANRPLFTALALERRMGLLIIALIIFIAALNITTTLILVVVERRRDIAILNAMGATGKSIMSIFIMEGAMIGGCGAVLGVLLGGLACFVGNYYRLVSLPAEVYSISNVPFNVELRDVLTAGVVALLLSLVATIYPA
ncbi:MAG: FtsX-like permease family protein, partial [Pyrinomonadaceae bacterium]